MLKGVKGCERCLQDDGGDGINSKVQSPRSTRLRLAPARQEGNRHGKEKPDLGVLSPLASFWGFLGTPALQEVLHLFKLRLTPFNSD
jgi:hypothetical protein